MTSDSSAHELPFEDEPKRLSSRRDPLISSLDQGDEFLYRQQSAWGRHTKPLLRFLRRQVGRPWPQVREEIEGRVRALAVDELLRRRVRAWIIGGVCEDVVFRHGVGWVARVGDHRCELYVDPETELLCYQKRRTKQQRRKD